MLGRGEERWWRRVKWEDWRIWRCFSMGVMMSWRGGFLGGFFFLEMDAGRDLDLQSKFLSLRL